MAGVNPRLCCGRWTGNEVWIDEENSSRKWDGVRKRKYDIGWLGLKKRGCKKERGTEKERLYQCSSRKVGNQNPKSLRKSEQ